MAVSVASDQELIPGYRLLTRLGRGGFGEVWKAEAPGGIFKAIKIVHGCIYGAEEGDAPARQELKALDRVKSVRHPFILSLERYDIVNGQLIIVTELADKNLAQRWQECRDQALPGIPYEELIRYLEESAEALDLMNLEHQLQHLDIKPQNIFLLRNHVKVADFGLVKDLEGRRARMTSGITAGYAAPEIFEGEVTPYCDQYSLAIVYQELLTGRQPFTGSNVRQLMMQHVKEAPDLEPLPPSDRPVIARALAKKPEERFPSCAALIQALRAARWDAAPGPGPGSSITPPPPSAPALRQPPGDATVFTGPVRGTPGPRSSAPGALTPKPPRNPVPVETPRHPEVPEPPEVTGQGLLFPALILGLGGTGCAVLRGVRKAMSKRWGAEGLPNVRLLMIDADPDELFQATQGDADTALRRGETLLARLQRPSQYLKPGRELQDLEKWLDPELLRKLPRDQVTPQGLKALGRLAFCSNAGQILSRLRSELAFCLHAETLKAAGEQTGLGLRTSRPRVYLVASPGGGTGGGMLLDLAYAVRRQLRALGYRRPDVQGLLLAPPVERNTEKARATANTYATLTEINYFAGPGRIFSSSTSEQAGQPAEPAPPFTRCMILPVPRGEGAASLQETATMTAEFLVRDLASPLSRVADEARNKRVAQEHAASETAATGQAYQSFGAYWFSVPRGILLRRVGRSLCHRLVSRWRADHQQGLDARVQSWIGGQLASGRLTSGELETALLQQAAGLLDRTPESALEAILADLEQGSLDTAQALQAQSELDALLGPAESGVTARQAGLMEILEQAAVTLAEGLEEQLPELALSALAEPHFRLLGVEERVQAGLDQALAELARSHRAQSEQLAGQAGGLARLMAPLHKDLKKPSFWSRNKQSRAAAEFLELIRAYAKARWQALVQHTLGGLYQNLRTNLQKYHLKVECCRKRISQFVEGLEASGTAKAHVNLGLGQYLLPAGCRSLEAATEQILAVVGEQELEEINGRVQTLIARELQAHVHVCTAPANFFKELEEQVLREVTVFAEAPLGRAHAAEMYVAQVAQRGEDQAAIAELAGAFHEAAPELSPAQLNPEDELNILAVPPGPEGNHFRKLVEQALPDQHLTPSLSIDDIVFYREIALSPAALPQMGEAAAKVYEQSLAADNFTPHSRMDIPLANR